MASQPPSRAGSSSAASPESTLTDSDVDMPDEATTAADKLWYTLTPYQLSPGARIETHVYRNVNWTMMNTQHNGSVQFANHSKRGDAIVSLVQLLSSRCVEIRIEFYDGTPTRSIGMTRASWELRPGPQYAGGHTLLLPHEALTKLSQTRHLLGPFDDFGKLLSSVNRCTHRPNHDAHSLGVDDVLGFENEESQSSFAQNIVGLYLSQVARKKAPSTATEWRSLGKLMFTGLSSGCGNSAETSGMGGLGLTEMYFGILQTIDPRGAHYDLHWRASKMSANAEGVLRKKRRDEQPPATERRPTRQPRLKKT